MFGFEFIQSVDHGRFFEGEGDIPNDISLEGDVVWSMDVVRRAHGRTLWRYTVGNDPGGFFGFRKKWLVFNEGGPRFGIHTDMRDGGPTNWRAPLKDSFSLTCLRTRDGKVLWRRHYLDGGTPVAFEAKGVLWEAIPAPSHRDPHYEIERVRVFDGKILAGWRVPKCAEPEINGIFMMPNAIPSFKEASFGIVLSLGEDNVAHPWTGRAVWRTRTGRLTYLIMRDHKVWSGRFRRN